MQRKAQEFHLLEIPMKVMDIHIDVVNLGLILSAFPRIEQRAFINLPGCREVKCISKL